MFSEFEVLKIGTMAEKTGKSIRNHICPNTTLSIKKLAGFESLRVYILKIILVLYLRIRTAFRFSHQTYVHRVYPDSSLSS